MTETSYIFLAGASRGVGREIAINLTEQNQKIKALLRSEATRPELEAMGIKIVMGDALDLIFSAIDRNMLFGQPEFTEFTV